MTDSIDFGNKVAADLGLIKRDPGPIHADEFKVLSYVKATFT